MTRQASRPLSGADAMLSVWFVHQQVSTWDPQHLSVTCRTGVESGKGPANSGRQTVNDSRKAKIKKRGIKLLKKNSLSKMLFYWGNHLTRATAPQPGGGGGENVSLREN